MEKDRLHRHEEVEASIVSILGAFQLYIRSMQELRKAGQQLDDQIRKFYGEEGVGGIIRPNPHIFDDPLVSGEAGEEIQAMDSAFHVACNDYELLLQSFRDRFFIQEVLAQKVKASKAHHEKAMKKGLARGESSSDLEKQEQVYNNFSEALYDDLSLFSEQKQDAFDNCFHSIVKYRSFAENWHHPAVEPTKFLMRWDRYRMKCKTPSIDDAPSYRPSLEEVLEDPMALSYFRSFLISEHSDENLKFYELSQEFSQKAEDESKKRMATDLFSSYLKQGATNQINISHAVLHDLQLEIEACQSHGKIPNSEIFLPASREILALMKTDSFERFMKSPLFDRLKMRMTKKHFLKYSRPDEIEPEEKQRKLSGGDTPLTPGKLKTKLQHMMTPEPFHKDQGFMKKFGHMRRPSNPSKDEDDSKNFMDFFQHRRESITSDRDQPDSLSGYPSDMTPDVTPHGTVTKRRDEIKKKRTDLQSDSENDKHRHRDSHRDPDRHRTDPQDKDKKDMQDKDKRDREDKDKRDREDKDKNRQDKDKDLLRDKDKDKDHKDKEKEDHKDKEKEDKDHKDRGRDEKRRKEMSELVMKPVMQSSKSEEERSKPTLDDVMQRTFSDPSIKKQTVSASPALDISVKSKSTTDVKDRDSRFRLFGFRFGSKKKDDDDDKKEKKDKKDKKDIKLHKSPSSDPPSPTSPRESALHSHPSESTAGKVGRSFSSILRRKAKTEPPPVVKEVLELEAQESPMVQSPPVREKLSRKDSILEMKKTIEEKRRRVQERKKMLAMITNEKEEIMKKKDLGDSLTSTLALSKGTSSVDSVSSLGLEDGKSEVLEEQEEKMLKEEEKLLEEEERILIEEERLETRRQSRGASFMRI